MIPVLATSNTVSTQGRAAALSAHSAPSASSAPAAPASSTSAARHKGLRQTDCALAPHKGFATPSRHLLLGGVLLAHLLAGWALWQLVGARQAPSKPQAIVLSLIAAAAPSAQSYSPPSQPISGNPKPPLAALVPPPSMLSSPAASSDAMPAEAVTQAVVHSANAAPAQAQAQAHAPLPMPSPVQSPATGHAPGPRQVAASAVRYLVEPQMTVPLLSRRLGESGVVHLRIVVDTQGRLKEASLKKSAGFARLDQQAMLDIRSARFAPYLENGQPVEWETVALLSYEIGR